MNSSCASGLVGTDVVMLMHGNFRWPSEAVAGMYLTLEAQNWAPSFQRENKYKSYKKNHTLVSELEEAEVKMVSLRHTYRKSNNFYF